VTAGALLAQLPDPRKVRTPKGRTLGKSQAAKADGKWHRKETASGEQLSGDAGGKGEKVG